MAERGDIRTNERRKRIMHECPYCGQACDCIGDDTWCDAEAEFCQCDCVDEDEDNWYGDEDWEP